MRDFEIWGFIALIGCLLLVTLSLSVFTGGGAIIGNVIAIVLGILSGGFFAASTWNRK